MGKTPVEEIGCTDSGSGTVTGPPGATPSPLRVLNGQVPLIADVFSFMLASDNLGATVTSSFVRGPGTYGLPAPDVTVNANVALPGAGTAVSAHVLAGSIVVETAIRTRLVATVDITFATDAGEQVALTGTVDVSCQYDETVCR